VTFQQWHIPQHVIDQTAHAFACGRYEVFVLWTAALDTSGDVCHVVRCIVPDQQAGITPDGVFVHIEGSELSRIQFDNFDRGERSVVQLHTHPGIDVRMSNLDRQWEVVAHDGALSIIVPSYGDLGLLGFPGVHVYERQGGQWRLWPRDEVLGRLKVSA